MKHSIAQIVTSKTSGFHLVVVLVATILTCSFLYMLGIPLVYWSAFGEGETASRIVEVPINTFILNWGALLIALILCITATFYNSKRGKVRRAKSYLLTALVVLVMYVFRVSIIDLFIRF